MKDTSGQTSTSAGKLLFIKAVSSLSDPSRKYSVRAYDLDGEVEWRCSCPDNVFRERECKHIKELKEKTTLSMEGSNVKDY